MEIQRTIALNCKRCLQHKQNSGHEFSIVDDEIFHLIITLKKIWKKYYTNN